MNKALSIFFIAILASNCTNDLPTNVGLINKINSMDMKTIHYELQVDSLGETIDTLSIERIKLNKKGTVIFKERCSHKKNNTYIKSTNYFRDNENLFYSKLESSELGTMSVTEFWEKNNKIYNGISYRYKNDSIIDSIRIHYKYFYDENNNTRKTIITTPNNEELDGKRTELHFDNNNIISELYLQNQDTIELINYYYKNNLLNKKIISEYLNDNLMLYNYDQNGHLSDETIFEPKNDSLIQASETTFKTNEKGEIIKSVKKWTNSNLKEYIIVKTVDN